MTKEMKQVFTRRITQANRTQLVVIVYEMLLVYLDEAASAYKKGVTFIVQTESLPVISAATERRTLMQLELFLRSF